MTRLTIESALDEVEAEKVNSLERPYFGRDDRVPAKWDAQHVGRRIVDAWRTDARMPKPRGPKEPAAAWPPYLHEFADWTGLTAMETRERMQDRNERLGRLPPTTDEITQRDHVLDWFLLVKRQNEQWCMRLMSWADSSYRNVNHEDACRARKWSVRTYWRHVEKAKGYLAQWLNGQNIKPW